MNKIVEIEITEAEMVTALREKGYEVAAPGKEIPHSFDTEQDFAFWLDCDAPEEVESDGWKAIENITGDVYWVALLTANPVHYSQVDSLARYFFEGPFAGEYSGLQAVDANSDGIGRLFILDADFTKSRHDDWGDSIPTLWQMLKDGTPIRKTNRSGPGTRGTRAVDGLHCDLWLAFS